MKTLLLRLSGFVVLCTLCILLALFALEVVFRDSSYRYLEASDIVLDGDTFSAQLSISDTLRLFKGCSYQVEENALYITVYSGDFYTSVRCKSWPVTVHIQTPELQDVEHVYFRDGASVRKIYPA